jgi:hypothetical protein
MAVRVGNFNGVQRYAKKEPAQRAAPVPTVYIRMINSGDFFIQVFVRPINRAIITVVCALVRRGDFELIRSVPRTGFELKDREEVKASRYVLWRFNLNLNG